MADVDIKVGRGSRAAFRFALYDLRVVSIRGVVVGVTLDAVFLVVCDVIFAGMTFSGLPSVLATAAFFTLPTVCLVQGLRAIARRTDRSAVMGLVSCSFTLLILAGVFRPIWIFIFLPLAALLNPGLEISGFLTYLAASFLIAILDLSVEILLAVTRRA